MFVNAWYNFVFNDWVLLDVGRDALLSSVGLSVSFIPKLVTWDAFGALIFNVFSAKGDDAILAGEDIAWWALLALGGEG